MNRKGQADFANKAFMMIFVSVVLILVVAAFFAMAIVFPVLMDTSNQANDVVSISIPRTTDVNATVAYESSFVRLNQGMKNLQWITYALLFGMLFAFLIFLWGVRTHAFLLPVWIVMAVIAIFVSIIISMSYYDITQDTTVMAANTDGWGFTYYLTLGLPFIVSGFFLIGGIILFAVGKGEDTGTGGLQL